jgi:hypothetical protein
MSVLDDKLFACHTTSGYTEPEWREILAHVVRKLEIFLGQPVAVHQVNFYPDGCAGDISSPQEFAGLLKLLWFGRIGVTVVGNDEATVLEATLFLHGAGKRLVAIDGNAFLWLLYERLATGEFGWTMKWLDDEFAEYETGGTEPVSAYKPSRESK